MNSIEEVLVLDGARNNEEWRNFKTITTENKNKQGEAYIPPTTKLPMSFMVARLICSHTSMRLLRVLCDSGGSCTWINSRALPRGCTPMLLDQPTSSLTLAGTLRTNRCVMMNDITLPEFDRNKKIERQGAFVFDGPCNYDLILGCDFLETVGLTLNFESQQIRWLNRGIGMKTDIPVSMAEKLAQEMNNNEDRKNYVGQILESK
jgi:hypothetical protein